MQLPDLLGGVAPAERARAVAAGGAERSRAARVVEQPVDRLARGAPGSPSRRRAATTTPAPAATSTSAGASECTTGSAEARTPRRIASPKPSARLGCTKSVAPGDRRRPGRRRRAGAAGRGRGRASSSAVLGDGAQLVGSSRSGADDEQRDVRRGCSGEGREQRGEALAAARGSATVSRYRSGQPERRVARRRASRGGTRLLLGAPPITRTRSPKSRCSASSVGDRVARARRWRRRSARRACAIARCHGTRSGRRAARDGSRRWRRGW